MGDRLLNVKEAAAMLGLKPVDLYQWADERRIAHVKIGGALESPKILGTLLVTLAAKIGHYPQLTPAPLASRRPSMQERNRVAECWREFGSGRITNHLPCRLSAESNKVGNPSAGSGAGWRSKIIELGRSWLKAFTTITPRKL